jgi:hypothetical protein
LPGAEIESNLQKGMQLTVITLSDFRRFANLELAPLDPDLTIVVGPNGSGKSTLLHALIPGGKIVGWSTRTLMATSRAGKLSAFLHLSELTASGAGDFSYMAGKYRAEYARLAFLAPRAAKGTDFTATTVGTIGYDFEYLVHYADGQH